MAISRWRARSVTRSGLGAPRTRRRARLASCRAASGERPSTAATSVNGMANVSCSTNASRSAGVSVSSTTRRARPTESASTASSSGSRAGAVPPAGGTAPFPAAASAAPGHAPPTGSSCRWRRDRSMFRDTRATTVVSQPPRFSTSAGFAPVSLSQVSWTASSASLDEPSSR